MKFKPIGERALVRPIEQEQKTASGIVLPETAKELPQTGEVVAVGEFENGGVSEGDVIIYARYAGTKIKLEEEEHLILDLDDLLGVIQR